MTGIRVFSVLLLTALLSSAAPAYAQGLPTAPTAKPTATPKATTTPASTATTGPVTPAPTQGPSSADLAKARTRLDDLEGDIKAGETGAKRLQEQMRKLSYQVVDEQGTLAEIRTNLKATDTRIKGTKQRLETLRAKMRERARELYKRGPTELIGVILGSVSMRDFVGRMHFANTLTKQDEDLVLQTRERRGELAEILKFQEGLENNQRTTVDTVTRKQDEIIDVFARQQVVLAKLAEARGTALRIVARYERSLGVGEFADIRRVAGRGMTISYGDWAEALLRHLGAPVTRDTLVAVVAWEASEGTQATWNPLATTMPMDPSSVYNSVGVRNYESIQQGLEATQLTLSRPNYGYEKILDRLEKGADAMAIGKAINKSHWCRGCTEGQYVIGIIPAVERYYERYAGE